MSEKLMITRECATEVRKSIKTIDRWIHTGYGKNKIKLGIAKRIGRTYLINPNTWRVFLWKIGKIYAESTEEAA